MPQRAGTIEIELTGNVKGLTAAMGRAERRMQAASKKMRAIGTNLTRYVTLPILGIGVAATKAFSTFEAELTGVAKTVEAPAARIRELGTFMMDLSESTGVARGQIARIAEAAGQLGIQTDTIEQFTETMVQLGVASNLAGEEGAKTMARFANITGMAQQDFDRLGATIVDLGNNLATTEAEIADMGQRLAGTGTQIGLTEAEILALAGAMSSVGLRAEMAGTNFSKVMGEIANAVGLGGEKLTKLADVAGMTAAQFKQSFEEDASEALVEFINGMARVSNEGGNVFATLEELNFDSQRLRDTILRLANAEGLLEESLSRANTAWGENTALTEEAAKFFDTLQQQIQGVWQQMKNTAALLGEAFQVELKAAIQGVKDFLEQVQGLALRLKEASPELKTAILRIAGIAAAVGPATLGLAGMLTVVGALVGGLTKFKVALTGIISGFVWLQQNAVAIIERIGDQLIGVTKVLRAISTLGLPKTFQGEFLTENIQIMERILQQARQTGEATPFKGLGASVRDFTLDITGLQAEYKELATMLSEDLGAVGGIQALADEQLPAVVKATTETQGQTGKIKQDLAEISQIQFPPVITAAEKTKDAFTAWQSAALSVAETLSQSIRSALTAIGDESTTVWESFRTSAIRAIQAVVAELAANAIILTLANAFLPGSGFAGAATKLGAGSIPEFLFGGFRAHGGPVRPDQSYVVGESGPEIFRPNQAGTIEPNVSVNNAVEVLITPQFDYDRFLDFDVQQRTQRSARRQGVN